MLCEGKESLEQLQQCLEKLEGQMQQQAAAMVNGQESLEKRIDSIVDGFAQQEDGLTQQTRENNTQKIDKLVALDSKIDKLAQVQEQQSKCTPLIF
jgi:hypothetical protein